MAAENLFPILCEGAGCRETIRQKRSHRPAPVFQHCLSIGSNFFYNLINPFIGVYNRHFFCIFPKGLNFARRFKNLIDQIAERFSGKVFFRQNFRRSAVDQRLSLIHISGTILSSVLKDVPAPQISAGVKC